MINTELWNTHLCKKNLSKANSWCFSAPLWPILEQQVIILKTMLFPIIHQEKLIVPGWEQIVCCCCLPWLCRDGCHGYSVRCTAAGTRRRRLDPRCSQSSAGGSRTCCPTDSAGLPEEHTQSSLFFYRTKENNNDDYEGTFRKTGGELCWSLLIIINKILKMNVFITKEVKYCFTKNQ